MKRTKKQITAYRQAALAILRQAGAQVNEANHRDYVVTTRLGPLYVSVWDNMLPCKFEDVTQARAELPHAYHDRLNPFSGKWNFNGGMTHEDDMVDLAMFQSELRRLLPDGHQPNPDLPLVPYEG